MNLFSTTALIGAQRSLKRPKRFLLDTAFTRVDTQDTEEVAFDVEIYKRKVAPFVAPSVQGKIQEYQGFTTKTFRPAYVKPKTVYTPAKALARAMGETLAGGQFTAQQRAQMAVVTILADHADSITRRMEIMGAEALRTGKVTVAGEDYPTTVVDYGRHADLTITLVGAAQWDETTSNPLADLDEAAEKVHEIEGASIYDVIMDPVAAKWFKRNAEIRAILDNRRAMGSVGIDFGGVDLAKGAQLIGVFGVYRIWVYSEYYEDVDGTTKPLLPAGTVIGISPDVEGVRAYGAILDADSLQAAEFFPKSWVEQDPSVRYIMTQSAPLAVLTRPNASFCINVLG